MDVKVKIYKTIILPVVLCGCETWSLTLREEHSLCGTHGRGEECVQVLMGKPEINRPLGRPRLRWENSITMDLTEIGWGSAEWS
jgi:hypothetical protein